MNLDVSTETKTIILKDDITLKFVQVGHHLIGVEYSYDGKSWYKSRSRKLIVSKKSIGIVFNRRYQAISKDQFHILLDKSQEQSA